MKTTDKMMATKVNYGGKMVALGTVWVDILRIAPNVKCAEMYLIGLMQKTKRETKSC